LQIHRWLAHRVFVPQVPYSPRLVVALVHFTFFFHTPAPPDLSTLSLHDALPIYNPAKTSASAEPRRIRRRKNIAPSPASVTIARDRKSTRLNSSHQIISYAVFCLKKKNNTQHTERTNQGTQ